jgi:hypothetical protein
MSQVWFVGRGKQRMLPWLGDKVPIEFTANYHFPLAMGGDLGGAAMPKLLQLLFAMTLLDVTAFGAVSGSSTVTLTEDDAKALQKIMSKDKLLQAMASDKGPAGLQYLSKIGSMVIKGPLKLELQWDEALFDGWRKANAAIVKIGSAQICDDIRLASVSADNPDDSEFFDELAKARGC